LRLCVVPSRAIAPTSATVHCGVVLLGPSPLGQVPDGWSVRFLAHAKAPEVVIDEARSGDHPPPATSPATGHDADSQAWLASRLLPMSFRPTWGSVELVQAALELVRTAVSHDDVQYLALASESCLPVAPLSEVRYALCVLCACR
jgi:hypothetical protein